MSQSTIDRLWTATGVLAVLVGFGAIGAAIAVAPWFAWTQNALSDLGHPARASAPLFNGGLVLAGLAGLAYTARSFRAARNAVSAVGVAIVAIGLVNMGLVGVFDVTHPAHLPVAVAFFAGITYGWFVHGSGVVLAGRARYGLGVIWLGVVHVTGWVLWGVSGIAGLAIPETVGAVLLAIWIGTTTRDLRRNRAESVPGGGD